jgi:hypothetical protein
MPADYGEITAYHHQEASRFYALAQEARACNNFAEADYLAGQAARWEEAAQEQKIEMQREPARRVRNQNRFPRLAKQPRGLRRIAGAIHRALFGQRVPFSGLSLR